MATNNDIEVRLRAIVEDFRLPGGGLKKIARLVANHLDWFEAAEARGMTWRDMIRALSAAGVSGREGKPLSVGTLSSAVWRERAVRSGRTTDPDHGVETNKPRVTPQTKDRTRTDRARGPGRIPEPSSKPPLPKQVRRTGIERSLDNSKSVNPPARPQAINGNAAPSGSDVLAFMKHAASLRKRREPFAKCRSLRQLPCHKARMAR